MAGKSTALVTRDGRGKTSPVTVTSTGLQVIEQMAAEGQDQRSIAKALGIDRKTMTELQKHRPDVEQAFDRGHAALADELTHHLLRAARKGNIVAAIYLTKARLGWREGDTPDARANITINLPDSQTPEAYLRAVSVVATPPTALPPGESALG